MKLSVGLLTIAMCCGLLAQFSSGQAAEAFLPLPESLVPLDSDKGREAFMGSKSAAFWPLVQYYSTQPDLGSCGVASSVMVLNALRIPRPEGGKYGEFRLFTPDNFFTPAVTAIKPRDEVSTSGMSLDQLAKILGTYPVEVSKTHAASTNVGAFREVLKTHLSDGSDFVLVNYLRKSLGQESGGHISPVGAFHENADLVLILDVSNYKYPWVWVKTEDLFRAMASTDQGAEDSRGYVVVSAKPSGR